MNQLSLINKVKYSKGIYSLYNFIGSRCIAFLKHFLLTDEKLIVFASFGGRRFDDSPKAIYEAMLNDKRFDDYRLVWAFMNPNNFILPKGEKVKIDTFSYYVLLLRARIWVTNSSMTRGLSFTGKNTFELNTWHGSAIKHIGRDISSNSKSFTSGNRKICNRIMLAQGHYDVNVFSKAFNMPIESFRITGLPRNDSLSHIQPEAQRQISEKLSIPEGKKVILYAPTFREYEKDGANNVVFSPPINIDRWKEFLGQEYVLLFRAHYEVARILGIKDDDFVKNVSSYPCLNELMMVSDVLISDYSSIFFDYAILGRPMLCFAYDYQRYAIERGVYFDIRQELNSWINTEDELIKTILSLDYNERSRISTEFRNKYIESYGHASIDSLNIIAQNIEKK